jgi:hypothetical protein
MCASYGGRVPTPTSLSDSVTLTLLSGCIYDVTDDDGAGLKPVSNFGGLSAVRNTSTECGVSFVLPPEALAPLAGPWPRATSDVADFCALLFDRDVFTRWNTTKVLLPLTSAQPAVGGGGGASVGGASVSGAGGVIDGTPLVFGQECNLAFDEPFNLVPVDAASGAELGLGAGSLPLLLAPVCEWWSPVANWRANTPPYLVPSADKPSAEIAGEVVVPRLLLLGADSVPGVDGSFAAAVLAEQARASRSRSPCAARFIPSAFSHLQPPGPKGCLANLLSRVFDLDAPHDTSYGMGFVRFRLAAKAPAGALPVRLSSYLGELWVNEPELVAMSEAAIKALWAPSAAFPAGGSVQLVPVAVADGANLPVGMHFESSLAVLLVFVPCRPFCDAAR